MIVLMSAASPAAAQEDLSALTSHEPLERILSGFADGEGGDGLFLPGGEGSGIVSQFQLVVNLGPGPTFGYQDVEMVPSGLPADGGLDVVSLEGQFDRVLGGFDFLPPLDPWRADGNTTDISAITEGWTAYGENGAIEGPVVVIEPATVVWGIELAQPFDEACGTEQWVGRAWQGQSVTSPNPPFTTEALGSRHPGTHDALAGQFSRLIEFGCSAGSQPIVRALRMTEDQGVRPFGPIDAVVLVNGNHVVFMHTGRTLTSVFDQHFFATPPGGGAVALSTQTDVPLRLLVPNPYAELPVRIELRVEPEEGSSSAAGLAPDAPEAQTLLYRPNAPDVALVGFQCQVKASSLFAPDLSNLTAEEEAVLFWLSVYSLWAEAILNEGIIQYQIAHPDGSSETVLINLNDGTWEGEVTQPPGSSDPDCTTGGTATVTGASFGDAGGDEPAVDTEEDGLGPVAAAEGDGTGLAWWIGLLGLAGVVGGAYAVTRARKRREPVIEATGVVAVPGAPPVATTSEDDEPVFEDSFLRHFSAEDAEWELDAADYERWKQLKDEDATTAWTTTEDAETRIQTGIETRVDEAMTALATGIGDFSGAVQAYAGAFNTILEESEGILQLFNEWQKEGGVKDITWWADLAEAVAGIGQIAMHVGRGTAKLAVRLAGAGDEAADVAKAADEAADATQAADEAAESGDWHTRASEEMDEFGEWLEEFTGMKVEDWGNGFDLRAALLEAARRMGYSVDYFHDIERLALQRIISKLTIAQRGGRVEFSQKDLAWLWRMGQDPDFWENLGRAAGLDLDARVYKFVNDVEIDLLRRLANSPEAADAARLQSRASQEAVPLAAPPPGGIPTAPPPGGIPTAPPPGGIATVPPPGAATVPPPARTPDPAVFGDTLAPPNMPTWRVDAPTVVGGGSSPTGLGGVVPNPGATPTVGEDLIDTVILGAEQAPTVIENLARTLRLAGGTP